MFVDSICEHEVNNLQPKRIENENKSRILFTQSFRCFFFFFVHLFIPWWMINEAIDFICYRLFIYNIDNVILTSPPVIYTAFYSLKNLQHFTLYCSQNVLCENNGWRKHWILYSIMIVVIRHNDIIMLLKYFLWNQFRWSVITHNYYGIVKLPTGHLGH